MRADLLLARAYGRARVLPEAYLEDALAAALESTDAWARLVRHFGWALPTALVKVSTQDRVAGGRSDIRLTFADGRRVVLELKADVAPGLAQMASYADDQVDAVIGVATTPRIYPSPKLLSSITWADLKHLPWLDPPLCWRQLLHLADTIGVTVPPIDVSALTGLYASFEAQDTFTTWSQRAADDVAKALTGGGAQFVTREKKRGRRYDERGHRRQVSWAWPKPWRQHPWAGVYSGLYFGHPHAPVLAAGLPDLVLCWQCKPGEALHLALVNDLQLAKIAARWASPGVDGTLRLWLPGQWPLLMARRSSAHLLAHPEPGRVYLTWVDSLLREWAELGITSRLQAHLPASTAPAPEDDDGPSDLAPSSSPSEVSE